VSKVCELSLFCFQEWLDNNLIGDTIGLPCIKRMPLATKDMEKELESNMQELCKFGEQIECLAYKVGPMRLVMHMLIGRFRELIVEVGLTIFLFISLRNSFESSVG
jgi:hypothetical protein